MEKVYRVLTFNPGSTSTKIAVYENENPVFQETIHHSAEDLAVFHKVVEEYDYRKNAILSILKEQGYDLNDFDAIVGRGGVLQPITSGTYLVNDEMVKDAYECKRGQHASNLGALIADELSKEVGIPAYVVDPVSVDEFEEIARISGWPELPRESLFHPLNQKAVARQFAKDSQQKYEDLNLIVCHMGGGISVGAHRHGRVIDVNGLEGGLFTPERCAPSTYGIVELCFSGEMTQREIEKRLVGLGGIQAHLGTKDAREVEKMIDAGDKDAELVYRAMAYQISKSIGMMAAVLQGKVDAILLTGGLAYSKRLCDWIEEKVKFVAPVKVYPGEKELESLALGGLRVLQGLEEPRHYPS